MSQIKYTKDGKKVVVLGKLNSEESIVQEVFVSDGQEIPAGENFVAKGLLDKPAESWKEKRIREVEQAYERRMADLSNGQTEAERRLRWATEKAKARADALMAFANNAKDGQLDLLRSFMAGEITHFWIGNYERKIVDWDSGNIFYIDSNGSFGRRGIGGIKLISLFGTSAGDLEYGLHDYRDGSGSWKTIIPCRSYDEAVFHAQAQLDHEADKFVSGDGYRNFDLAAWKKIEGIKIPDAAIQKCNRFAEKIRREKIEKLRAELDKLEKEEK